MATCLDGKGNPLKFRQLHGLSTSMKLPVFLLRSDVLVDHDLLVLEKMFLREERQNDREDIDEEEKYCKGEFHA